MQAGKIPDRAVRWGMRWLPDVAPSWHLRWFLLLLWMKSRRRLFFFRSTIGIERAVVVGTIGMVEMTRTTSTTNATVQTSNTLHTVVIQQTTVARMLNKIGTITTGVEVRVGITRIEGISEGSSFVFEG